MFSDNEGNEYLTPEDVENKRFKQNKTSSLDSDIDLDLNFQDESVEDLDELLKEVQNMDLNFVAQTQMTLYGASDSEILNHPTQDYIVSNNITLYESLDVTKIIAKRDKLKAIFRVTFDIKNCMDTLNITHLSRVENYYKSLTVKQKKELDTQDKLLHSFSLKANANSYRYIKKLIIDSALPSNLKLSYNYIAYRILNPHAIQDINVQPIKQST